MNVKTRVEKLESAGHRRRDWRGEAVAMENRLLKIYGELGDPEPAEADLPETKQEWVAGIEQIVECVYTEEV